MRFALRLALLVLIILLEVACVRRSGLGQGIVCFRAHNYRQAFIHLKPLADRGQPDAQYAVGYMYYYGRGVVEDRKKAWCWIRTAARAGQADAVEAARILKTEPKTPTIDPLYPLIYHSD